MGLRAEVEVIHFRLKHRHCTPEWIATPPLDGIATPQLDGITSHPWMASPQTALHLPLHLSIPPLPPTPPPPTPASSLCPHQIGRASL